MENEKMKNFAPEQIEAINICLDPSKNRILLNGLAGSGKSTVIEAVKAAFEKAGKKVVVTGTTGMAAKNIDGKTIHSVLKIPPDEEVKMMSVRTVATDIDDADVLIIDEVSMLTASDFAYIMKKIRSLGREIKLILCGDFCQLPCVCKENKTNNPALSFLFLNEDFAQENFLPVLLEENHRQSEDSEFNNILNKELVRGKFNPRINELVETTQATDYNRKLVTNPTLSYICSTNKQKDEVNNQCLDIIDGNEEIYTGNLTFFSSYPEYFDEAEKHLQLPVPKQLRLKPFARVILLTNDPEEKYVNGSQGFIKAMRENEIEVILDTKITVCIKKHTWKDSVYVPLENNNTAIEMKYTYTQFPITLAYAKTVHKVQGLTIGKVIIDPNNCFAHGQLYTMLSRTRSAKDIALTRALKESDLIVDKNVIYFCKFIKKRKRCFTPKECRLILRINEQKTYIYLLQRKVDELEEVNNIKKLEDYRNLLKRTWYGFYYLVNCLKKEIRTTDSLNK